MPKITTKLDPSTALDVSPQEAADLERMGLVATAPAKKAPAKRAPRKKAAAKSAPAPSGSQPADTTTGRD